MSDPERWSEGGEASELERELLAAGQGARLPDGERRALWASIALSLPAAPPAVPEATTGASLGKLAALAGVVASLGLGAWAWVSSAPSNAPVSPPVPWTTSITSAAPAAALPSATPEPPVEVEAAPPASAPKPRASSASRLGEETAAVLAARAALRAGDAPRCLSLLEQARLRFGRGALGQEREALTIEALAKAGRSAEARRRAAAFLSRHPQSPYATDLRRIAEN